MKKMTSLFYLVFLVPMAAHPAQPTTTKNSQSILPAVAQAIEDEIYDLKHEGLYFQIDGNPGGDDSPATITMYVSKEISENGIGVVIYKDMPYGEVYRYFKVDTQGLVRLVGNATSKFPPTGGSMLTIYMRDDQICNFIQSMSYKSTFTINPQAPKRRIHEAEARQIDRIGFSFRLGRGKS